MTETAQLKPSLSAGSEMSSKPSPQSIALQPPQTLVVRTPSNLAALDLQLLFYPEIEVIAFDFNWAAPANFQLSFCSAMGVTRNIMLQFRSAPGQMDGLGELPAAVRRVLEDPRITKVGFALGADLYQLGTNFGIRLAGQVLDMQQEIAVRKGKHRWSKSLKKALNCFHIASNKSNKQLDAWNALRVHTALKAQDNVFQAPPPVVGQARPKMRSLEQLEAAVLSGQHRTKAEKKRQRRRDAKAQKDDLESLLQKLIFREVFAGDVSICVQWPHQGRCIAVLTLHCICPWHTLGKVEFKSEPCSTEAAARLASKKLAKQRLLESTDQSGWPIHGSNLHSPGTDEPRESLSSSVHPISFGDLQEEMQLRAVLLESKVDRMCATDSSDSDEANSEVDESICYDDSD